ncbi:SGNH/GDSL hydrolase family protein [Streptomyces longwoodensis]|uniref:SGNH/GDSL hydrolase family protein n=1 Tax=Streptomyces longwoodensis TaxID=68231 RepID=UPI0033F25E74
MSPVRFVALGDSLTEGVGDPTGDGWRGWAALLADGLGAGPGAPVRFTNLAVSGAQTRDVLERRLPAALGLRPEVAAVVVGVNDTLRRTFDIHAVAARLDRVYGALAGQGAVLLTACLPDPGDVLGRVRKVPSSARRAGPAASGACSRRAGRTPAYWLYSGVRPVRRECVPGVGGLGVPPPGEGLCGHGLGLPGALGRPLARRQQAVNTVVHALSERYGAVQLHAAEGAWVTDRALWSADWLHPGERGHRHLALRFHALLAEAGLARGAAPSAEPEFPVPTRAASLRWLATAGTGWVLRRCTDLLPNLLTLAADEVRHRARGTSAHLDLRASAAVSAALAAVAVPERGARRRGAATGVA